MLYPYLKWRYLAKQDNMWGDEAVYFMLTYDQGRNLYERTTCVRCDVAPNFAGTSQIEISEI